MDRLLQRPPSRPIPSTEAGAGGVAPLSAIRPGQNFLRRTSALRSPSLALPNKRTRNARLISDEVPPRRLIGPLSLAVLGGYATGSAIVLVLWQLI